MAGLGVIIVNAGYDITGTGRLTDITGAYIYCEPGWVEDAQKILDEGIRPRAQLDINGNVEKIY